ncbi:nitroreductase family deazaflavin-dependent oxidoreductase [Novosphingobium bradum]|uniref:Nitroreductase family deazaflavin-dependent oxidoreductase n=1 Tax=Novosphingobium bradum TaxID=1737444 RepID=A0ABV7IUA7_9SPHN
MVKPDEAMLKAAREQGGKSAIGTPMALLGDEHVRLYRETNGETGYEWNGATCCLLTTTGRKSGLKRTIPIIFTEAKGKIFIIGSQGGHPDHPLWYLNLQADPHATLQIKGDVFETIARTAESPEREELWAEACKKWPNYDVYQTRTTRRIPVVVFDRVEG